MNDIVWLNSLNSEQADVELQKCCGSKTWANRMVERRPFLDTSNLLAQAELIWWALTPADWLEAFRSHPKIGEKKAAAQQSEVARSWSEQEQSGTHESTDKTKAALVELNRKYVDRFGYIFIVCATGKTADEMLTILKQRLNNDADTELRVAAEEQNKITQLRLKKLLAA